MWMSQTETTFTAVERRRGPGDHRPLHPIEFGGVLEILTEDIRIAELDQAALDTRPALAHQQTNPSPPHSRQESADAGAQRYNLVATPTGEVPSFPSPHLLRLARHAVRHYPLRTDFSLERVDYFTNHHASLEHPPHSELSHVSPRINGQVSPPTGLSPMMPFGSAQFAKVLEGGRSEPRWLEESSPLPAHHRAKHTDEDDLDAEEAAPPAAVRHSASAPLDISVGGLQRIIDRVSDQLRQRELQRNRAARAGSLSPGRRAR
jgi:hypothetical protein